MQHLAIQHPVIDCKRPIRGCPVSFPLRILLVAEAALFWRPDLLELAAVLVLAGGRHMQVVIITGAAQVQGYGIGKLQRGRPVFKKPVRREGDPWRA